MTGRQRIEQAFAPEGTPEPGAALCYQDIFTRDHFREFDRHPWWYRHSPDLAHQLEKAAEFIERTEMDWFAPWECQPGDERQQSRIQLLDGVPHLVDARTGARRQVQEPVTAGWRDRQHYSRPFDPDTLPRNAREVERSIPLPEPFDADRFVREGRADFARALRQRFPDLYLLGGTHSPFWALYGQWGYEGMMLMAADRPALAAQAAERLLANSLRRVRVAAALGCRGVWIEECMTDQISPQAFAELVLPSLQRVCDAIRGLGMHGIYYYCGNPSNRLELLLAAGADALSLEEGKKGFEIDLARIADAVQGRCVLLGNLDAVNVLERGDDQALRHALARQLEAGRRNGNRFVASLGSPVTPATPVSRVRHYCRLVRELARGGC